jgi:hypothetical protein
VITALLVALAAGPATTCKAPTCLPIPQALSRAVLSAASIAELNPLPVEYSVGGCRHPGGSLRTVDCFATFTIDARSSCKRSRLLIRVRYRRRSRHTVASYPRNLVCLP